MQRSPDKKKILFAISSLGRGGAEKQLYLLLSNINRTLYECEVLCFNGGPWEQPIRDLGIPLNNLNSVSRIHAFWGSIKTIRRVNPYFLHCFGGGAGFLTRLAGILLQTPCIITSERYAPETKNRSKLLLEKILGFFTNKLICNAKHSADFYRKCNLLAPEKILTVHNGVELPKRCKTRTEPEGAFRIGYLANLRRGKNHDFLIRTFARIIQNPSTQNLILLLGGEGVFREPLMRLAKDLGIEQKVTFLGSITSQDDFFANLDLYCHISLFEGTPNAIMEAMVRNVPCVASSIPGNCELITSGHSGILVSPTNETELIQAIETLVSDKELRATLANHARKNIEANFSIEKMVAETEAVYKKELGIPHPGY